MQLRIATRKDLPHIIALLADDALGKSRERFEEPLPASYISAFALIDADPNQELLVLEDGEGTIIGTLQMTFTPSLSFQGSLRATIESVRIHSAYRGCGFGRQMIRGVIERARARGARIMQLASNKQRPDAIRFYESLGFKATHEGMKAALS